ncbi:hypothetical protein QFZ53_002793 [Microbacterium natoriense]|uniref:Uncharacterized protein n=1 Tax=Microbacterium natoriense TaxID=284570 RepID=A0AAW8F027_9MICO|nr:hypothetical protein [Microbacterium natoriense]MDQ0648597.1 hypothetical protein [Microbacterium natoriense]
MSRTAIAGKSFTQESIKAWAERIADQAPPLADDQFQQLHTLMVGSRREASRSWRKAA